MGLSVTQLSLCIIELGGEDVVMLLYPYHFPLQGFDLGFESPLPSGGFGPWHEGGSWACPPSVANDGTIGIRD